MSLRLKLALKIGEIIGGNDWYDLFAASDAMNDYCIRTMDTSRIVAIINDYVDRRANEFQEDRRWAQKSR